MFEVLRRSDDSDASTRGRQRFMLRDGAFRHSEPRALPVTLSRGRCHFVEARVLSGHADGERRGPRPDPRAASARTRRRALWVPWDRPRLLGIRCRHSEIFSLEKGAFALELRHRLCAELSARRKSARWSIVSYNSYVG